MKLVKIEAVRPEEKRIALIFSSGRTVSVVRDLIEQLLDFFSAGCQIEINCGGSQLRLPGAAWFVPFRHEGKSSS